MTTEIATPIRASLAHLRGSLAAVTGYQPVRDRALPTFSAQADVDHISGHQASRIGLPR